jgi:hypothetical protein
MLFLTTILKTFEQNYFGPRFQLQGWKIWKVGFSHFRLHFTGIVDICSSFMLVESAQKYGIFLNNYCTCSVGSGNTKLHELALANWGDILEYKGLVFRKTYTVPLRLSMRNGGLLVYEISKK